MLRVKTKGFKGVKKFADQIEKMSKNIENNVGDHSIVELFSESFINSNTNFSSFSELVDKAGVEINNIEDWDKISEEFINTNTNFATSKEMKRKAIEELVKKEKSK